MSIFWFSYRFQKSLNIVSIQKGLSNSKWFWGQVKFSLDKYVMTVSSFANSTPLPRYSDTLIQYHTCLLDYLMSSMEYKMGQAINPLYAINNKLGIAHCTYLGVSGYHFPKILYSFV